MCQFKSFIVKKKSVIWYPDTDNHTTILERSGIKDNCKKANFVRCEMLPSDGDIFNHKPSNWVLNVDQDYVPSWFDKAKIQKSLMIYMKQIFKEQFIINSEKKREIENSNVWIKNSKNVYVKNSSAELRGNSSAVLWGNSSAELRGNSSGLIPYSKYVSIKSIKDNASVKDIPNKKIIVANKEFKKVIFKKGGVMWI
jgi:hypothetical protein